jgi:uncharacterized 2Fe-2S/4Fe-4S cluster protein (DUF4445 family)
MASAVRGVIKIETATEPRFQELFVAAMALPHATSLSPNLSKVVDLPVRAPADSRGGRRRRGSRTERAPDDVPGDVPGDVPNDVMEDVS